MLWGCFPLAIGFTFGSVYMSMPLSHFVPAYPAPSPCQVHSLIGLRLYSHPANYTPIKMLKKKDYKHRKKNKLSLLYISDLEKNHNFLFYYMIFVPFTISKCWGKIQLNIKYGREGSNNLLGVAI